MMFIGYSGLAESVAFRQREFPSLEREHERICQGFDSAVALLAGSDIVAAAAEERFTRVKATGAFPENAFRYCLREAGARLEDVEAVAHAFDYGEIGRDVREEIGPLERRRFDEVYAPARQIALLGEHFPEVTDWPGRFVAVPHHMAHAASTFYPSGFDEALIVVADGMGEHEGLTVARGDGERIEALARIPSIHSLGILYSVFTLYLGFEFNMDEYKVMGLAPYGNPRKHFAAVSALVTLHDDGSHTIPLLFRNETALERETYAGSLRVLEETFGPARRPESEITRDHQDIAAALQATLQGALLHLLRTWQASTGLQRLAMAGGVALNCTANGVIKRSALFREMFVQPAAGDDGAALGAALHVAKERGCQSGGRRMSMPFLGPDVTKAAIIEALDGRDDLSITHHSEERTLLEDVAARLLNGEILAWCQGRMEFGPRALGARSIVADPRGADMRERINSLVKKREDFRPFAPAVVAEEASDYFDIAKGDTALYEHMLCVTSVREEHRAGLPAITHVDGSARVQTVDRDANPRFWKLLRAFEAAGGLPMVLNTSFNVRGQPVVCNAVEAVQTFLDADLDALAIGEFVVTRADRAEDVAPAPAR